MEVQEVKALLEVAVKAAYAGGVAILEVYQSEFAVEHKEDKSPLTLADKNAHKAIVQLLEDTELPILSEEGASIDYAERSRWDYFWMVDPLDGTKEFIKRNGEFTVNIALIHQGKPIAGVIYVPVTNVLYFGAEGMGSYKLPYREAGLPQLMGEGEALPQPASDRKYTVVASRSHLSPETETLLDALKAEHGDIEIASMGSSLKICLVAEGSADLYPRYAPTMEWDTAAGHAIALGAGKAVIDYTTNAPMRYNKENLLNNWFMVK